MQNPYNKFYQNYFIWYRRWNVQIYANSLHILYLMWTPQAEILEITCSKNQPPCSLLSESDKGVLYKQFLLHDPTFVCSFFSFSFVQSLTWEVESRLDASRRNTVILTPRRSLWFITCSTWQNGGGWTSTSTGRESCPLDDFKVCLSRALFVAWWYASM